MKVARTRFPRPRILDFACDLRLGTTSSEHDALAADITGLTSTLNDVGIRYHAKEGEMWRPTRRTPRLGFGVDTYQGAVRMEERKVLEGLRLREAIFGATPGSGMSARTLLPSASLLNFLRWVISGWCFHLRSVWGAVNESGAMDQWRSGRRRPSAQA